jgi:hypothetical protein
MPALRPAGMGCMVLWPFCDEAAFKLIVKALYRIVAAGVKAWCVK